MAEGDPLFETKNSFHLGNYQQCIKEAQKCRPATEEQKIERDCFLYRAYLCQKKFSIIFDEIRPQSVSELRAVRMFAEYLSSGEDQKKRTTLIEALESKVNDNDNANDIFYLMAAQMYMGEQNFDSALRILHSGSNLECHALTVQCLLKIDRVDLAIKEVKKMQEIDEDATLTQLALAWTSVATGKEKLQEAFYIYQEMMDKYGASPLLLTAQATALALQQKYDAAETALQEAMEKDPNYPEALINLISVSQFLGKTPEQINRYIGQMKDGHSSHPWTRDYIDKENQFKRIAGESAA